MAKGDGKHWAEVDDDVQCIAYGGQRRIGSSPDTGVAICRSTRSGSIEHELDILEWVDRCPAGGAGQQGRQRFEG